MTYGLPVSGKSLAVQIVMSVIGEDKSIGGYCHFNVIINKLYLNTVATELMCFYKYSKNVFIHIYIYMI